MGLSLASQAAAIKSPPECCSLSDHANSLCELFFSEARQAKSSDQGRESIFTITALQCGRRLKTTRINLFNRATLGSIQDEDAFIRQSQQ